MTKQAREDLIREINYRRGGGLLGIPWEFYETHKAFYGSDPNTWTDQMLQLAFQEMDRESWNTATL